MLALGQEFKNAREARQLTLRDAAEQLHILPQYLAALEDERWVTFPDPISVRGFLRTYARFLELDAEMLVSEYNEAMPAKRRRIRIGLDERDPLTSIPASWIVGGAVVLLFSLFFLWNAAFHRSMRSSVGGATSVETAAPIVRGRSVSTTAPDRFRPAARALPSYEPTSAAGHALPAAVPASAAPAVAPSPPFPQPTR